MNRLLLLSATTLLAATAAAQTKGQVPDKPHQVGYFPAPGSQALVVGGSDDCSTASVNDLITGPGSYAVTNVGATTGALQGGCPNRNSDVWFYYVATATGTATVETCGTVTVDTTLAAWADGPTPGACPCRIVACSDDACGLQSRITFDVVLNQGYFLQLGSFSTTATYSGTFQIIETPGSPPPPPPANDDCATPLALPAGPGVYPFDNSAATAGCEGQAESLCLFFGQTGIGNDTWYTWTPTMSGTAELSVCGQTVPAGADTKVAIYDTSGCPVNPAIACNDDAGTTACPGAGLNSIVSWSTVCGQTYLIQLGRYPLSTNVISGTFTITETGSTCVSAPGVEYCFGDNLDPNVTTPCPCSNFGAAGNGCASSFNAAGAHITASGQTALDNVVLTGTGMQASGICVFLQGDAIDPNGFVFGDGVTCTGGALIRLRGVALGNPPNGAQFPVPPETVTLSQRGGVTVGSGAIRSYTVFYRNAAAAFCPPFTFNAANSYRITW